MKQLLNLLPCHYMKISFIFFAAFKNMLSNKFILTKLRDCLSYANTVNMVVCTIIMYLIKRADCIVEFFFFDALVNHVL